MKLADKPVSRDSLAEVLSQAIPQAQFIQNGISTTMIVRGVGIAVHVASYVVIAHSPNNEYCGWSVRKKSRSDADRILLIVCLSAKGDSYREAQYFIGRIKPGRVSLTAYDTNPKLFGFDELAKRVNGFVNLEIEHRKNRQEVKKMEEAKPMLGTFKAGNGYEYRFLYGGKVRSGYGHTEAEAQANAEKRRAELKARDEPPKPKEEPANEFAIYFPPNGAPPTFEKRGKLKAGDIMRALAIITREASYDFYECQILEVVRKALKGEVK